MTSKDRTYYPNMDILRYVLSIAVIIAHTGTLAGNELYFPISSFEAVGGFFALSGFLMYPNYMRHGNVMKYASQRARRILPPYFFIVILCALGLVFVSNMTPVEYFTSPQWWKYLIANLCFLNWLQPDLPGVFQSFEIPAVNGSLWTMKVEWCLYFSVPLFIYLLNRIKVRKSTLAIIVVIISIAYRILFTYLFSINEKGIYEILARQIFGQLSYFYCGMIIYFNRDYLKKHLPLMLASGIILYIISSTHWILQCIFNPLALSLLILGICFLPVNLNFLSRFTNVSYEMYLFHFPVIQLSALWGINHISSTVEYSFVFIVTILLCIIANRILGIILHK